MRAYYFTIPSQLDSVLENGVNLNPWRTHVKLSLDKDQDLIDAMMTVFDTNQVVIIDLEIPDRTWLTVKQDSVILYQPFEPTWIVDHSIVSKQ